MSAIQCFAHLVLVFCLIVNRLLTFGGIQGEVGIPEA